MAYIGKQPIVGNFQICDAISVVNGQAAYTMQVASTNVSPESASHMLVSLNGILQKPGSSFTVSGATITFASNLATGDVIDFIILLGDALNSGTPSDGTVTTAKLAADAVTEAKIADDAVESEHLNNNIISGQTALGATPADTDELLVSDAGTLKRVDFSYLKGGAYNLLSTSTVTSAVSEVDFTSNIDSTYKRYEFHIIDLQPATNAAHLYLRLIPDGGSVITASNYGYTMIFHGSDDGSATFGTRHKDNGAAFAKLADEVGSDAAENLQGKVTIFNPASTTNDYRGHSLCVSSRGDNVTEMQGAFRFDRAGLSGSADQALTGVRFYMSSGNITSCIIKMYGIT